MAFKRTIKDEEVKGYVGGNFFWAIGNNVGYGYPNNPTDVLLVQFFINNINAEIAGDYIGTYGDYYIEEDGKFGSQTWNAIRKFQKKMGGVADGMVSAAKGENLLSRREKKVYTIYELNSEYKYYRGAYFEDLKMDRTLPRGLCKQFEEPDDNIFD